MTNESIAKLAEALCKAQGEMPAASFDATNPFLKNEYASLGSIIKTAQPILTHHGLSVTQLAESDGEMVGVTTMLMHTSGESISSTMLLPLGEEKGLKPAQVAGSIITYIRRYQYAAILGMYAEEDTDGNEPKESEKPATKKPVVKKEVEQPTNGRPYSPDKTRLGLTKVSETKYKDAKLPNAAQQKLLRYGLELCYSGIETEMIDTQRHKILEYLTGKPSSKDVSGPWFKTIVDEWLKMKQDTGGEYTINQYAAQEARAIAEVK